MKDSKSNVTWTSFIVYVIIMTCLCIWSPYVLGIIAALFHSIRGLIIAVPLGVWIILAII